MRRFNGKVRRLVVRTFAVVREAVRPATPAMLAARAREAKRERIASEREAVWTFASLATLAAMLTHDRLRRLEPIIARFWNRLGIDSPDAQLASEAGRWFDAAMFGAGSTSAEAIASALEADTMRVGTEFVPYSRLAYTSGLAYVADAGDSIRPAMLHAIAHVRDAARRTDDGKHGEAERTDVQQAVWLVIRQERADANGEPSLVTVLPSAINRSGLESLLCSLVSKSGLPDNGLPVKVSVYAGSIRDGEPVWLVWNIAHEASKRRAMFATSHERAARAYLRAADSIDARLDSLLDIGAPTARDSRTVERWFARRDALVRRSLESASNAETFAVAPSRSRADRALTPNETIGRGFVALVSEAVASVVAANVAIASGLVRERAERKAKARAARLDTSLQDRAYAASIRNGKVRSLSDAEAKPSATLARFAREHVTSEMPDARVSRIATHWANVAIERARTDAARAARDYATDARRADAARFAAWAMLTARRYQTTEAVAARPSSLPFPIAPATDVRAARLRRRATARLACVRWSLKRERALMLTSETGAVAMF